MIRKSGQPIFGEIMRMGTLNDVSGDRLSDPLLGATDRRACSADLIGARPADD
jgi:hypothetical protein